MSVHLRGLCCKRETIWDQGCRGKRGWSVSVSHDAEMGHAGGSPHLYRCPLLPSTRLQDSESHSGRLHPWTLCDLHLPQSGGCGRERAPVTQEKWKRNQEPQLFHTVGRPLQLGMTPLPFWPSGLSPLVSPFQIWLWTKSFWQLLEEGDWASKT